ncbi:hypothetical protein ACYSUO_23245 [Streptomyces sp. UC4497]
MTPATESEEELLRRAFHIIGDEAGKPDREASPRILGRHRGRTVALIAAAAVSIGLLAYGLTGNDDESASGEASSRALKPAERIACAAQIVDGTVLTVRPAPEQEGQRPEVTVSLTVKDWVKPTQGPGKLEIEIPEPKQAGAPLLRTGDRVLFEVWNHPDIDNTYFTGRKIEVTRKSLYGALGDRSKSTCPDFWKRRQDQ